MKRFGQFCAFWVGAGLIFCLNSCRQLEFYGQAVQGQWKLSTQSQSISRLKKNPKTSPELVQKFVLVEEILAFASQEMALPVRNQYRRYLDLGRPYLVWNVFAAPEFSLRARTWNYPFLGKLSYRGFFKEENARAEAEKWKSQGDDVAIGGVRAYSTLGWFSDPLLNTFIKDHEVELADLILHELTHARLFIHGDTAFNEAFATANARMGVRRWLHQKGQQDPVAAQKLRVHYEKTLREEACINLILRHTRRQLEKLYAIEELSLERKREQKRKILAEAATLYRKEVKAGNIGPEYATFFEKRLNNARLSSIATYYDWVPAFEAIYEEQDSDCEKFYKEVERLGKLDRSTRHQILKSKIPSPKLP